MNKINNKSSKNSPIGSILSIEFLARNLGLISIVLHLEIFKYSMLASSYSEAAFTRIC